MEMNEKKIINLINCDSDDKEKMIEAVKAKLRWYTFEASEEEFDPEAVDMLVKFLRETEPELGKAPEVEEVKTEQAQKQQKNNDKSKIVRFGWGKIAAAVIIGVLALTVVGTSLGTSQAWEDGGFFRWLRRDKDGQTMITSPEDLGMDMGRAEYYYDFSKVPEEYQQYLIMPQDVEVLNKYNIDSISVHGISSVDRVCEFLVDKDNKKLTLGMMIYDEKIIVMREQYDEMEYKYSKSMGDYVLEVYAKENLVSNIEYTIFFFKENIKYFVSGQMEVEFIEEIAEECLTWIENNK